MNATWKIIRYLFYSLLVLSPTVCGIVLFVLSIRSDHCVLLEVKLYHRNTTDLIGSDEWNGIQTWKMEKRNQVVFQTSSWVNNEQVALDFINKYPVGFEDTCKLSTFIEDNNYNYLLFKSERSYKNDKIWAFFILIILSGVFLTLCMVFMSYTFEQMFIDTEKRNVIINALHAQQPQPQPEEDGSSEGSYDLPEGYKKTSLKPYSSSEEENEQST